MTIRITLFQEPTFILHNVWMFGFKGRRELKILNDSLRATSNKNNRFRETEGRVGTKGKWKDVCEVYICTFVNNTDTSGVGENLLEHALESL